MKQKYEVYKFTEDTILFHDNGYGVLYKRGDNIIRVGDVSYITPYNMFSERLNSITYGTPQTMIDFMEMVE